MSNKRTVHEDEHSKFVKVGGYVARPVYPVGYQHVYDEGTDLEEGDKVYANHTGGRLAKVGDTKWYIHGEYREKDPVECWKPPTTIWENTDSTQKDPPEFLQKIKENTREVRDKRD